MRISLLLPTRKRPKQLIKFLNSVVQHANNANEIEVILSIDEDDLETQQCALNYQDLKIIKLITPRDNMGKYNTQCYRSSVGDIIMLVNDDVEVRTPGWDTKIKAATLAYSDEIYLLYPNDYFKRAKLPVFPILSRKACEILKMPFPESYTGSFIDTHLLEVFIRLKHAGYNRIQYLEHIVFEHMHYRLGKSVVDKTYLERNRFGDEQVFLNLKPLREAQADALISAMMMSEPNPFSEGVKKVLDNTDLHPPKNFFKAILLYWKSFVRDNKLPLIFRINQAGYFLARFIYQRYIASASRTCAVRIFNSNIKS